MDSRYTKAIIMLVVGFPVLMAGIVIDKALESDTGPPRQSTVTIARLMMASGAIMVTVGIFFCCTITLNKKEKIRTPRPLVNSVRTEQPQLIIPLQPQVPQPKHSTPKRKATQSSSGIRLLSYSPASNNQNSTHNVETSLNAAPVYNSPSVPVQSGHTPPSSNRDTCQFSSTSSSTHEIVQYPSTSGMQKTRQHVNASATQNINQLPRKSTASHRISQHRSASATDIISQHSSTTSTQNISLHSSSSGAQHSIKHLSSSSDNIVYQVSSADMAKLLMAAKKTMDPKSFDEIACTYKIALLSTPGRHAPDPSSRQGVISNTSSAERISKSSSSGRKHTSKKAEKNATDSAPVSDAPSAPPYQSSPEIEPPPYSP